MLVKTSTQDLLETELIQLSEARIVELRRRYHEVFKRMAPPAFGPDLLRRSIAYRLQERMYGGLSANIRQELLAIAKASAYGKAGKLAIPRKIKPGSVLIREWKGTTYRVTVDENGFLYDGKKYTNLSEIARAITGTRWNGPRFFGLRALNGEPANSKNSKARQK
jgi:hypothetical protein